MSSRNKVIDDFLVGLLQSWEEHGPALLDQLMAERPNVYFQALVELAQVHHHDPSEFDRGAIAWKYFTA